MASVIKVFISSAFDHFQAYRQAAITAILQARMYPMAMEHQLIALPFSPAEASRQMVDESEICLLLLSHRYGAITEQEYRWAREMDMPILVFKASSPLDEHDQETDPTKAAQLAMLKEELQQYTSASFSSPHELEAKIYHSLIEHQRRITSPSSIGAPCNLPPRIPNFVGREHELSQIEADLHRGDHIVTSLSIAGMAGVGKSVLAAEVVHHIAKDATVFSGGITWVRCNDLVGWQGLSRIYDQLLLDWGILLAPTDLVGTTTPQLEAEAREQVLRARLLPRDTALVLLDNVERDLPLDHLLPLLFTKGIVIMLTTRTFFILPQLTLRRLNVLPENEALILLAERYQTKEGVWMEERDRRPGVGVVHILGYLPLAIELAAARAARQQRSIAQLEQELHEPGMLAKLRDPAHPQASIEMSLSSTLLLLSADEQMCFASLGMLASVDYPWSVLLATFTALLPEGIEEQSAQVLDLLLTLSLVMPGEQEGIRRVRIHPLLQEVATARWQVMEEEHQQAGWTGMLAGIETFIDVHWDQVSVLRQDEALLLGAIHQAQVRPTLAAHGARITVRLQTYLVVAGRWRAGIALDQWLLESSRSRGEREQEGLALYMLGFYHSNLGKMEESQEYYGQALVIRREIGDLAGEGEVLNALGTLANIVGKKDEAQRYYEQALLIRRKVGDRRGEGATLNELGVMVNSLGKIEEALRYYEQSLLILREVGDRRGEGITLNNLGRAADNLGRREEAQGYYEQALLICQEVGERRVEGAILSNLGILAVNREKREEAQTYYEQALLIRRAIGDLAGEATTLNNLGSLVNSLGKKEEARIYYEQALQIRRDIGDLAGEGATLYSLGWQAMEQGNLTLARQYITRSLELFTAMGMFNDIRDGENTLAELVRREQKKSLPTAIGEAGPPAPSSPSRRRRWPWQHC